MHTSCVPHSLIDATFLELVLPHSTYPPHILLSIPSNALSTTSHEEVCKVSQAVVTKLDNLNILIEMLKGPTLAVGKEDRACMEALRGRGGRIFHIVQKSPTVERLKVNKWQYFVLLLFQTKSETVLQKLREAVDMVRPLLFCQFFLTLVNK